MKKGGIGGANTKTGLYFEGKVDFLTFIKTQQKIILIWIKKGILLIKIKEKKRI